MTKTTTDLMNESWPRFFYELGRGAFLYWALMKLVS
jgi:hypothetical protein